MSEPYLGQIEIFAFDYAPRGWMICAGQLLSIAQNQDLFSLLGTTFGGDGRVNFALPDLRSSTPIGQGKGSGLTPRPMGEPVAGEEGHNLLITETPFHSHNVWGRNDPTTLGSNTHIPGNTVVLACAVAADPQGAALPIDVYLPLYPSPPDPPDPRPVVQMAESAIGSAGGGQPHPNMMPFVTLNVCISLQGPIPKPN
jgi:microcystin-dependent protein